MGKGFATAAEAKGGNKNKKVVSIKAVQSSDNSSRSWWVIDPRTNKLIGYWDLVTTVALLFVALVTPVEVSFMEPPPPSERWGSYLFLTNRVIDVTKATMPGGYQFSHIVTAN